MAHAESITFWEFRTRFSTEEACRAELFRLRFPNGFVCPKCGCTEYYPVRGRNAFQCRACRHQTSVTAGTVMHRTHLEPVIAFARHTLPLFDLNLGWILPSLVGLCIGLLWRQKEKSADRSHLPVFPIS